MVAHQKGPKIALIALTYNGAPFVVPLVSSLLAQTYEDFEIVFIDNDSSDDTVDRIRHTLGSDAHVIVNPTNLGCASGYNIGAAACPSAEVLCFLNQDLVLDPDYCRMVACRFAQDPGLGAIQPLVRWMRDPRLIENCGHTIDRWMTARTVAHGIAEDQMPSIPGEILFTLTAPAIRRTFFDLVGGFDDDLGIYYEDTDLALRIWEAGGRICLERDVVVYHVQEGSSRWFPDEWRAYLWTKNRIRLLWKHADDTAGYLRAASVTLGASVAMPLLLIFGPPQGRAVARALVWNVTHWHSTWLARQQLRTIKRHSIAELQRQGVLRPSEGMLPLVSRAFLGQG